MDTTPLAEEPRECLLMQHVLGVAPHLSIEHTAHHLDMGIPLYRLREARKMIEELPPQRLVI